MYRKYLKRPMDFILAFLAIIILSPVLLIIAILVKIKLGSPIIFRDKRVGKNNKVFNLYKFRSMTNEKNINGELLANDDRLTKFGKRIRNTSLDELPELINIIKGDMSIVGPRPLSVEYLPYYTKEEQKRHTVTAGLTGLAQINGRNTLRWEEKFKYDLTYIKDIMYLWTGRSAINYTLEDIDDDKVALLPAYTCDTVIQPFLRKGYKVIYYNVLKNLEIDLEDLNTKISNINPTVALFHSYFGFDTLNTIKDQISFLKGKGSIIIEDLTHSLFSNINHIDADYYIGSFRKWIAIPDGGFSIKVNDVFNNKLNLENRLVVKKKLEAFQNKYLYMEHNIGDKSKFLKMYQEAESIIEENTENYLMSNESKIITSKLDKKDLAKKRRNNFNYLLNNINNIECIDIIFKELSKDIVPLYFPIYVKEREKLQNHLAKYNIYAPVIWPMPENLVNKLGTDVIEIYNQILAIPCDQRYGVDEMKKIVDVMSIFKGDINQC